MKARERFAAIEEAWARYVEISSEAVALRHRLGEIERQIEALGKHLDTIKYERIPK